MSSYEHAKALLLSLLLSTISTVLCLLLAYPLAMILHSKGAKARSFIVFISEDPLDDPYDGELDWPSTWRDRFFEYI